MKVLKWLLGVVVVLAAVVLVGGMLLPSAFTVERSATVNASPDKVYALVADPKRCKDWGAWNQRDPAMQITYSGPPSGVGAVWEWKSKSEGDGRMTFTVAEPGKRVGFDLFFPDFGTTSHGELSFSPEGSGTKVVWTMKGEMGSNPMWRWMGLLMDRMVGKDFDTGLANLGKLAASG